MVLLGQDGVNEKSAYQAAIDGGYSCTEQEFNQALGNLNQLFTSVSDGKSAIALNQDLQKMLFLYMIGITKI